VVGDLETEALTGLEHQGAHLQEVVTIAKAARDIANALNTVDDIYNSNILDEDQKERKLEDRK
jgi:hypothetical protein